MRLHAAELSLSIQTLMKVSGQPVDVGTEARPAPPATAVYEIKRTVELSNK